NVVKYCLYQKNLQRYTCKDCCKTFNDKTGSLLHYKHVSIGNWMLALWLFLCGPLNGASIRFISQATGQAYKTAYYMMRGIMAHIRNLPEKPLKGTCETDEAYVKAGSTYVFVARVWPGYLAFCYPPIATYVFVARVWPGYLAFCYPPIAIP
ncbi:MAG: IS1 family transposase, partial [Thaumarchaeota archaeon]|nr:IS1 family transposase [Nitrososphaerota archaeon]